jgi:hypothetical protein
MLESCRTVHCAVWRILPGVDVVRHYWNFWSDRRPRHLRRFRARESSSVPALCVFVGRFCGRDADLANLVRAMSMKSAGAPRRSSRGMIISVAIIAIGVISHGRMDSISCVWSRRSESSPRPRATRLTKLVVRWMSVEGQIVMTRPAGAFAEGWSSAGSPKGAIDTTGGASVGVGAKYEW